MYFTSPTPPNSPPFPPHPPLCPFFSIPSSLVCAAYVPVAVRHSTGAWLLTSLSQLLAVAGSFSDRVELDVTSPFHSGVWSGLNLHGACACCHSCVTSFEQLSCRIWRILKNTVSLYSFATSNSWNLSNIPSTVVPEPWGRRVWYRCPFRAKHCSH